MRCCKTALMGGTKEKTIMRRLPVTCWGRCCGIPRVLGAYRAADEHEADKSGTSQGNDPRPHRHNHKGRDRRALPGYQRDHRRTGAGRVKEYRRYPKSGRRTIYKICLESREGVRWYDYRRTEKQNRQSVGRFRCGRAGQSAGRDRADHLPHVHPRSGRQRQPARRRPPC